MKIILLVVGKTTEKTIISLLDTYLKRLSFYLDFSLQTLPELKNTKSMSVDVQKEKEGEMILKATVDADELILLDEHGKDFTSLQFATEMQKRMSSGKRKIYFVIGGPYGFSKAVYDKAQTLISLSKMTFSHQLIRVLFVEQVYRAMTIIKGEPYHHE